MTAGRGGPAPVVLLGLALGVDLWALQTYGLGVDPDPGRLHLVLLAAHLPVVVVALSRASRSPPGLVRALLPSLLAVLACAVVEGQAADPAPSPGILVDALAATTWGWLCVGGLGALLLGRVWRDVARTDRGTAPVERLLALGTALLSTALGLTMPATGRRGCSSATGWACSTRCTPCSRGSATRPRCASWSRTPCCSWSCSWPSGSSGAAAPEVALTWHLPARTPTAPVVRLDRSLRSGGSPPRPVGLPPHGPSGGQPSSLQGTSRA